MEGGGEEDGEGGEAAEAAEGAPFEVDALFDMGFEESIVHAALADCHGDGALALERLLMLSERLSVSSASTANSPAISPGAPQVVSEREVAHGGAQLAADLERLATSAPDHTPHPHPHLEAELASLAIE